MAQAFGSALLLNPMIFAIRRYTTPESRPFAFSIFYVAMNMSAFSANLVVNAARNVHSSQGPQFLMGLTLWRCILWLACVFGALIEKWHSF